MQKTKMRRLVFIFLPLAIISSVLLMTQRGTEKTGAGLKAVCAAQAGYAGAVTVFDGEYPVYKWYSAAGVPLAAEPSPDGVHLAVLCAAQGKSVVHIFSLDSEDELSSCSFSGELFFGIGWLSDSKLCVLSENRVCAVSVNGKKRGEFDFGGLSLAEYEIYDGGIGLYLRGFESGGEQRLVSLDSDLLKTDRDQ